jgi:uncharacterized protein YndB with AHSA1/START domain
MNDSADQYERVRFNQFVRAPIQRVYAAYIDPTLMAKWMGLRAITDVSGPLDRTGATFVGVVFGPYRPRSEVLAAEPPVLHEMGGRTLLEFGYRWTARFAEKDDGTEITFDAEVRFPAGLIGRWVRRSEGGGRMELGMRQRLAKFAKLVEAGET